MKKAVIISILFLLNISAFSKVAKPRGVGIIAGAPTGISIKYFFSSRNAADGAVAWSSSGVVLHTDYLRHIIVKRGRSYKLPFYFGLGAKLNLGDNSELGARVPLGINYIFKGAPFDLFAEFVPVLNISNMNFEFDVGGGIRFFF